MSISKELEKRSSGQCELCKSEHNITTYMMPSGLEGVLDQAVVVCDTCNTQIKDPDSMEPNHWRCLNDSMWSEIPAVQVLAWRLLNRITNEGWPQDLLDMMFLDEETMEWAKAGLTSNHSNTHVDSNGTPLSAGDTVVLTQTLNVKGSSVAAKRGYAVRNISLVYDNPEQIEGKIEGQSIVILTKYVKKK